MNQSANAAKRPRLRLLPILCLLAAVLAAGCASSPHETGSDLPMAPLEAMPIDMRSAPLRVRQAYQLAVGSRDLFTQIPCYCGCGAMGHTSNYDCYVSGTNPDGTLTYDSHALLCALCVDITHDTARLLEAGKTAAEARQYIDLNYARFGRGTGS